MHAHRTTQSVSSPSSSSSSSKAVITSAASLLHRISSVLLPSADTSLMTKPTARMYVTACSMLYGSTYLFTKQLQETIPSCLNTCLRFSIASVFFIPTVRQYSLSHHPSLSLSLRAVEIGLYCAVGFIALAVSLDYNIASKVAFFTSLSVVFVPLLAQTHSLFLPSSSPPNIPRPRINRRSFVGPVLAVAGVALMELGGVEAVRKRDVLMLSVAPISFALTFYRSELLSQTYPDATSYISGVQIMTVALCSLLWCAVSIHQPFSPSTFKAIVNTNSWISLAGLLYTGILTTAWTFYVDQKAIGVLSAAGTSLVYSLDPVFAAAFSSILLHERLEWNTLLGAAVIVCACAWSAII